MAGGGASGCPRSHGDAWPEIERRICAGVAGRVLDVGCGAGEHLAHHRWNRERGRLPGQCRIRVRHGRLATEWFDYLFVSETELRALVDGSPWTVARWERDGHVHAVELTRAP